VTTEPIRMITGDLSETDRVFVGVQVRAKGTSPS